MHQQKYTIELISKLGLLGDKPLNTFIDTSQKLTTREYDEHIGAELLVNDEVLSN